MPNAPEIQWTHTEEHTGKLGDFVPSQAPGTVEVVGRDMSQTDGSLESILGMDDARMAEPVIRDHPATAEILGAGEQPPEQPNGNGDAELQAELRRMYQEQGRIGQEVIGPLRTENAELRARLDALEARSNQPQQQAAPINPADLVPTLFGSGADREDPQLLQMASVATTVLDAAERGTRQYVGQLEQKIDQLTATIQGTRELTGSGLTMEQVQQAEQKFPELTNLPEAQRYSLLRRLSEASKPSPQRDPQTGKFVAGAAPPVQPDPANVVEGSGGVYPGGGAQETTNNDARFQRFQELGRDRKRGGARAMTNVFLDMMRNGSLNQQ